MSALCARCCPRVAFLEAGWGRDTPEHRHGRIWGRVSASPPWGGSGKSAGSICKQEKGEASLQDAPPIHSARQRRSRKGLRAFRGQFEIAVFVEGRSWF